VAGRRLVCACEACAILFSGRAETKYRRVPRDVEYLADFRLTDVAWEGLQVPINLAFFLHSSPAGQEVAFYPSPAGATESLIPAEAWQWLAEENPILQKLEPDVEALLINRNRDRRDHYRVGIDECYRLVGIIRTHWSGFSGGQAMWDEIDRFFNRLQERAGITRASHA
jgi:hypothetical protein